MKKSFVIIIAFILIIGITLLVKILIGDEYAKAKEVMKYLDSDSGNEQACFVTL